MLDGTRPKSPEEQETEFHTRLVELVPDDALEIARQRGPLAFLGAVTVTGTAKDIVAMRTEFDALTQGL